MELRNEFVTGKHIFRLVNHEDYCGCEEQGGQGRLEAGRPVRRLWHYSSCEMAVA